MRRKRLQHIADTLCHKFCGWETFFDYNALVDLGNGNLYIDILSGQNKFKENVVSELSITKGLIDFFNRDCRAYKIDKSLLKLATLTVELSFKLISEDERVRSVGEHFMQKGRNITKGKFHQCRFDCRSIVDTDEKSYKSNCSRTREWPVGWPDQM